MGFYAIYSERKWAFLLQWFAISLLPIFPDILSVSLEKRAFFARFQTYGEISGTLSVNYRKINNDGKSVLRPVFLPIGADSFLVF